MRLALPLLVLSFSLALSGCAEKPMVFTPRPKVYQRIVSLSPSTTEIVASDGDANTLKGRTAADNFPGALVLQVPIVAQVKPDYEKIQSLKPQLIVYDKSLYSDQDVEKLKAAKADMFAIDAKTVDDFVKQLYELGSMLGFETRFNDYIERILQEQAAAKSASFPTKPKVAIIMPSPDGNDMICGTKGFLGDVVNIAGGELVGPATDNFGTLNAESFVALNPDVIIVGGSKIDSSGPGLIMKDPRFKTIAAVKGNFVRALDQDVLYRRGQRVDMLINAMHKVISPEKR
jgi:iron complex transport system substrate-binding protein